MKWQTKGRWVGSMNRHQIMESKDQADIGRRLGVEEYHRQHIEKAWAIRGKIKKIIEQGQATAGSIEAGSTEKAVAVCSIEDTGSS